MRDILCNGPRFEIIVQFSMENTLNSRKKGKYYHRRQKITFYFFIIQACNQDFMWGQGGGGGANEAKVDQTTGWIF